MRTCTQWTGAIAMAVISCSLHAQSERIKGYDWGEARAAEARPTDEDRSTVVLRRVAWIELDDSGEDILQYDLFHNRVLLKDAGAIERENKVYVQLGGVLDVLTVKARSIGPDGTVHVLGEDAFRRATDDDERGSYVYFAFEGLVPGSVIEYCYVLKKRPGFYGTRLYLQLPVPVEELEQELVHPARLGYKAKSYHGAPSAVVDTLASGAIRWRWTSNNVPALDTEESANMGAAQRCVIYALDRVTDRNLKDYSGYLNATKAFHGATHQELDGRAKKELSALMKRMQLPTKGTAEEKVRAMEDHLKNNYQVLESNDRQLMLVPEILRTRTGNNVGMTALMCNVLMELGIEHQVLLNTDRSSLPFDPTFECYTFLDDVGLFFPSFNKYLSPGSIELRLGYLPAGNMANHALFIRNYDLGGAITGVGVVKYIAPLPDSATVHDHFITADIREGNGRADLRFEVHMTGYYAGAQCYYSLLDEDRRKEVAHAHVEHLVENGEIEGQLQVLNGESRAFGVEPFIVKGRVNTAQFNGRAGDKMLFKVGELIGPQVEMYAEKPRTLPVDDDFNRRFIRHIDVLLPAGWTVNDLSDLQMDIALELDGEKPLRFKSTAEVVQDTLKVRVEEYYRRCQIPLEHFAGYRSVVNAAADFNKAVLVLTRKDP